MLTRKRAVLAVLLVLLMAVAWTSWSAFRAYQGLRDAEMAVDDLRNSIGTGDRGDQHQAARDLDSAADRVVSATGGWWWGMLTHAPIVGDDFDAVRVIGSGLERVGADGVAPLLSVDGRLGDITVDGRIDLGTVRSLRQPLAEASGAFRASADEADSIDPDGLLGALSGRFAEFQNQLDGAAGALEAGSTAVELLPDMAGGEGQRNYLLIFQNNAEIRATGGLPGSWARVRADDGALSLQEQGAWADFPTLDEPVLPLTPAEEVALQGGYGLTFQSPGYSRDFPRAAELWNAFWERRYPATPLDGVIAIDPVALSYLVRGTGPVQVGGTTLNADNLVQQVLNEPYLRLRDPAAQDAFFRDTAQAVFGAVTGDLASPADFIEGIARAGREGRLLVAPFDEVEAERLDGTPVAGQLTSGDERVPYVGVGLNDATASKMSYFLRYDGDVTALSCVNGRQQLAGALSLRQNISPAAALKLPTYITGGGNAGTEPGSQLLSVQLYGPPGGTFGPVQLDGKPIDGLTVARLDNGQPVVRLSVLLDSRDDVRVTWTMESGEGQDGDPVLDLTPSVVPGDLGGTTPSACG